MLHLLVRLQTAAHLVRTRRDERGATAVEYALMVGLLALGVAAAVTYLQGRTKNTITKVANTIP